MSQAARKLDLVLRWFVNRVKLTFLFSFFFNWLMLRNRLTCIHGHEPTKQLASTRLGSWMTRFDLWGSQAQFKLDSFHTSQALLIHRANELGYLRIELNWCDSLSRILIVSYTYFVHSTPQHKSSFLIKTFSQRPFNLKIDG